MSASVFISHVYEDRESRNRIFEWAERGLLGPNLAITGEVEDVRQQGATGIRRELSPRLRGAAAVIVLVGRDTHNHDWVNYEAQFALSHGKLVIPVRIPGTTGAPPPALATVAPILMDPETIRLALQR